MVYPNREDSLSQTSQFPEVFTTKYCHVNCETWQCLLGWTKAAQLLYLPCECNDHEI